MLAATLNAKLQVESVTEKLTDSDKATMFSLVLRSIDEKGKESKEKSFVILESEKTFSCRPGDKCTLTINWGK